MHNVILLIVIEIVILLLCFIAMIYVRASRYFKEKRKSNHFQKLYELFSSSLNNNKILDPSKIPYHLRNYKDLLNACEYFNRKFLDDNWRQSRDQIIEKYMLQKSKKLMRSSFWQNRQLGLRAIDLNPIKFLDESVVTPLLNDPKYLVRMVVASCMIHSEKLNLILPVLKRMKSESHLAQYPYRDLLINGNKALYDELEKIAYSSDDPEIIATCLDILSLKIHHNLLPLAIKYSSSPNIDCQLTALKILGNIPGQQSEEVLCLYLKDQNNQIRVQATKSLAQHRSQTAIPYLIDVLEDSDWYVRLHAALGLKSMGIQGVNLLNEQKNPVAYEIAQYVLTMPSPIA